MNVREAVRLQQAVDELLSGHDGGPVVDVDVIARAAGAQVVYNHFPGGLEAAFVWRNNNPPLIGVNSAVAGRRQRWALAHSLGHLLLHAHRPLTVDYSARTETGEGRSVSTRTGPASPSGAGPVYKGLPTVEEEAVANRFAARLLMPAEVVQARLSAWCAVKDMLPGRDALIGELAREFAVSGEAMGFRLLDLGLALG